MSRDDALKQVVISNRFASEQEVEEVRAWGARHHPSKDLAELLFMRGIIDRGKVGLVRRVAKMSRSGALKRPRRGPGETELAAPGGADPDVTKLETQGLPERASPRKGGYQDPEQVGRYEILERVAAGGMGVVYKARHTELDRHFAVKVLTPRTQTSPEALERFKREAKLAARLDHPHVVRIYDAGTDDADAPYLVMDFIDGADLGTVIKEEGLGVRKAAQIARKVALGLEHAHERGIVHRDIKPDNVLIDRESGEPKITDFGIVKDLAGDDEEEAGKLTRTGFTLGSPCYMSPEQAAGKHELVGPTSDVYSLAATLYEMLTGSPPFEGDSIHAIMVQVIRDDPVPLRRKNQAIPPDLEVICLKGLEKEPGQRYASARELADDLGRFLDDEPIHAKPAGLVTKAWRLVKRHRAVSLLLATLVGVLLVGGGSAWSAERQRRQEAQAQLEQALSLAIQEIQAAGAATDGDAKSRHYYEAIRQLDWVLLEDPSHKPARERKRETVLALGDHLIESGEASFAEFVFYLGTGLVDEAVISSRVQAARLRSWSESAAQYERAGDLREALRLYRAGLQDLHRAGYAGEHVAARVRELEQALEEQQALGQVDELRRLAQVAAAKGDHAAAYHTCRRALEVAPDDAELQGKVAYHREKAAEQVKRAQAQVDAQLGRVQTAWGVDRAPSPSLQGLTQRAQAFVEEGDELLAGDDFAGAQRQHEQALALLETAFELANADRARERADLAAEQADAGGAERYALRQVGAARELYAQGKSAFQRASYVEAATLFDRARQAFRQASLTSSGKAVVSDAREDARSARASAGQALIPAHRPPLYAQAEDEFSRAEARYAQEDYEQARAHYERAASDYKTVLSQASLLREAYGLRARTLELQAACQQSMAERFAGEAYADGQEHLRTGEAELARSHPAEAAEAFRRSSYRLERALARAQPQAEGLRECQALRAQLIALKGQVEEAELEWKGNFGSAMEDLEEGDKFVAEARTASWKLAKRRYARAIEILEKILN